VRLTVKKNRILDIRRVGVAAVASSQPNSQTLRHKPNLQTECTKYKVQRTNEDTKRTPSIGDLAKKKTLGGGRGLRDTNQWTFFLKRPVAKKRVYVYTPESNRINKANISFVM
jgi:hypothetical protein